MHLQLMVQVVKYFGLTVELECLLSLRPSTLTLPRSSEGATVTLKGLLGTGSPPCVTMIAISP